MHPGTATSSVPIPLTMQSCLRPLLFTLTCLLCLPAVASGQEEPRLDPDSPAGVEYQIPLDQARDDASGGAERGPGADGGAPLFGAGISKAGSKGSRGSHSGRAKRGTSGEKSKSGAAASVQTAAESTSDAPSVSLIAAAVLLAGGALGLGLRRGLGRTHRS